MNFRFSRRYSKLFTYFYEAFLMCIGYEKLSKLFCLLKIYLARKKLFTRILRKTRVRFPIIRVFIRSLVPQQLFFATRELVNNNGVLALFRGLTITLARELPSYFCFFGAYEAIRETLKPEGGSREDCGLVATSVAGGVGGILLWAVTFPVDVVKSRIQLDDAISTRRWVPMLMNIYQNEGFSALYSGLAPTLVRTVPSSAMLFIVYEYTKKLMSDR
ncbi:mitochondrial ornithine transporter 1-like isoform X2 [Daktulosphaira vitifoliae]|uniref:mitochondrial ornithine transporter 1-like isoform X2 n=1 Tax=Daktulosphaira vitifoliae TaxID=58002 RepID=UPI0021AA1CA9|nr:mitochondrial ornithine transporter 1-like isoform X2 [Daktulosphaira vitifoliae]